MSSKGGNFLYLNRDGRWPGFAWRSLEAGPDGALRLTSLPALTDREAARTLAGLPSPDGPAGLAVASGTVWWTDAKAARLLMRDPCDGVERRVPLDPDAWLVEPRGLALHPSRRALVIADAGSHRLLLVALGTWQLADEWGGPGSTPGLFNRPTGVAVDGEGAVYVVEAGSPRVQKLDLTGVADPAFEAAVAASAPALARPVAVAVEGEKVWVLDAGTRALFAFGLDGSGGDRLDLALAAPLGLAVLGGALYVGDNATRRLVRVDPADGHTFGEARGFAGPVAALAGDLWVHPGGGASPVRLEREGAAVRQGVLWGGPVTLGGEPHTWQRLQALGDPGGGLVTFFVHAGSGAPPDPDPARLGDPDGGFGSADWRRIGEGVGDVLVRERSLSLWIGALLVGDGRSGPRVEQLRVSFDEEGYAEHLPVIYRQPQKVSPQPPPASRETLERFLALFESFFADAEREIGGLRRLFDPATAPAAWLDWLAGWLALDLEEGWPEEKKRRLLAGAFASYAWRGTARGLARALADRLGIQATVEEPHAQTGWWVLPGDGAAGGELGVSTRLAPASPQGAVLGGSAVLDASHLIEDEDVGEPLFTGTAYQFSVVLPHSGASAPATLEAVRRLIEREKPAHTSYQICLVEPGIRVGYQALLGVDTLLGGGPAPAGRLGEPAARGGGLAGDPPRPARASRLGVSTRLGGGSVNVPTRAP
ncbi:MAG: phage tail protein I, partial [Thermoanaerobaculia bacterium]